jgi:hypothetical protein
MSTPVDDARPDVVEAENGREGSQIWRQRGGEIGSWKILSSRERQNTNLDTKSGASGSVEAQKVPAYCALLWPALSC